MSEPHMEPPTADVRSFLPRPGEAVDDYASRLRSLHHDLSLVLDAVERGLAAAEAAPVPAPAAVGAPVNEVHDVYEVEEPHRSPPPPGPLSAPRGSARVEVISTSATARDSEHGGGGPWSGPPEPEGSAPWTGRRASRGEGAPVRGEPAAPSPERSSYSEPWVERGAPPPRREPWVERGAWPAPPAPPTEMYFAPAPHTPRPRRRAPALSPVVLAALVLSWLTVIALVLALALNL